MQELIDLQDIITILYVDKLTIFYIYEVISKLFHIAEVFTRKPGKLISIQDSIIRFK